MRRKLFKLLLLAVGLVVGLDAALAKDPIYVETDLTSQFPTDYQGWVGASGLVGWAAPTVKTNDGREVAACERYESTCATLGDVFSRTFTNLAKGTYKIELYGGAAYTFGRGFTSEAFSSGEFQENDKIETNTGVTLYAKTANGTYGGEIPIYYATNFNTSGIATVSLDEVEVGDDGRLTIGMNKTAGSTNWHVIQIKGVTARVDISSVYANLKEKAENLVNDDILMSERSKEAILSSIADDSNFTTAEEYQAAIDNINNAIATAKKELAAQKFFIKNVETGKFWGAGNNWGTRASLVDELTYVKFNMQDDGTYTMESMVTNGGTSYYFGGDYMDGSPVGLTITRSGNYATIALNGSYFGYDGSTTVLGKGLSADSKNALWQILTEADVEALKADLINSASNSATLSNPFDLTLLLQNAQFGRNRRDLDETWAPTGVSVGGANDSQPNGCIESYHKVFSISQTITGLPNGLYGVTAQGFYRQDGSDNQNLPYFYANNEKETFGIRTGTENDMTSVGAAFQQGKYYSSPIMVKVTDGQITLGAKNESNTNVWAIWDNFQLKYYGESTTDFIAAMEEGLSEEAKALFNDNDDVKAAKAGNAASIDNIEAALQAAIRSQKTEDASYSGVIVNPSFENGNTSGWVLNGNLWIQNTDAFDKKDGTYFIESWAGEALSDLSFSQTITDLPNGVYELSAYSFYEGEGAYIKGNNNITEVTANKSDKYTVTTAVTDGILKIEAGVKNGTAQWVSFDNFELKFISEINTVNGVAALMKTQGNTIVNLKDLEVLTVGSDYTVVQEVGEEKILGLKLNNFTEGSFGKKLDGQLYGSYDATTYSFNVLSNSGNKINVTDGEATVKTLTAQEAALADSTYRLVELNVATIALKNGDFYATQDGNEIKIDKRLDNSLVMYDGDFVNTIKGVTFLEGSTCVLAPLSQDDIVPMLWYAEDITVGEAKVENSPIDLTGSEAMLRMKGLKAGDILSVTYAATADDILNVMTADGRNIFQIPVESAATTVEIPVTADMESEIQSNGVKIYTGSDAVNAKYVIFSTAKYNDVDNSIWLGEGNGATLGIAHFADVHDADVLTVFGADADLTADGTTINATDGTAISLTQEQALAMLDATLSWTTTGITKITLSKDGVRNDQLKPASEKKYAQGETVSDVDGIFMTFGGNQEKPEYKFYSTTPSTDKMKTLTEGINQYPLDDNDKEYSAAIENLPTKGTYYVFEPTKYGTLTVSVSQEAGKELFFTEDGKAVFSQVAKADYNGPYSFDVTPTKTYYLFANGSNLGLYGFTFKPVADSENLAKDIATFKRLPKDNADGDTLQLKKAVITYVKGDDVFVEDASGAIDIYESGVKFQAGQVLGGIIIGMNSEVKHLPVLKKIDDQSFQKMEIIDYTTPVAKAISVAEATKKENLGRFVKLENLELTGDAKGAAILVDAESGKSIYVSDRFFIDYKLNEVVNSIEGIVGINADSTFVLWPTSLDGIDSPVINHDILEDGKFVLRNVASGLFWGAGNNWGTRASLLDYSEYQTLAKQPDGTYTMETQVSNGGTSYFFGGDYMDGQPINLTITPVKGTVDSEEPLTAAMFKRYASIDAAEGTATGCAYDPNKATGLPYGDGNVYWLNYADLINYDKLIVTVSEGAPRFCMNRTEDNAQDSGDPATTKFIDIAIGNGKWGSDAYLTKEDNTYTLDLKKMREERGLVHLHSIKGANWANVNVTSMTLTKSTEKLFYTVANGDEYFGNSTEAGTNNGTFILGKGLAADDKNALWEIVPATTESLAKATETDPVDATFLILNPNFGRNNRNGSAWKMDAGNKNMSGGTNENRCAESWRSTFTLSQELEVPNGIYALNAQAALTDYANLYDGNEYPVVYANDETAVFNNMVGSDIGSNMNTLSNAFANGNYKVNTIYVNVTDGKLTIGVKGTRTDTWCIWDNFQLKYYGTNANIENLKGGAEAKELENLRKKATELIAEVEIANVKSALETALNETANVSGAEAIKAAVAKLTAAVDLGEASKTAKNVLPKMKELVDATNVYTEEAYNEYYGTWLAKYEAGTLTKAEANGLQDPTVVTGWHASITVDNFLLSAWDTNPDFNNAAYYINSWSVEGDNDGSDFHVPFFEYWTGDDQSLGEKTLTATMNGLAAGEYNVSAWVRVRMKNGASAPAYGINLQTNNGAAVNVAAGSQIGDSQFFLDNFTATGTVGADGVLNIKFNVAADNNISWLSFKNVKFQKAGGDIAEDPENILANGTLEGDDVTNFVSKEAPSTAIVGAAIVAGAGKDGSRGIVVKSAAGASQDWDTQFWIVLPKTLENGRKFSVSFDYKASVKASADTQCHNEPGQYLHWACIGSPSFTTEWQHYEWEGTVPNETNNNFHSIAFNLAKDKAQDVDFFFDNIVVKVEIPNDPDNILANGVLEKDDVSCFFAKEAPSTEIVGATIVKGAGTDGSRGIVVKSAPGASQDWDTQFWIRLPEALPNGKKFTVSFDYKASMNASADTQCHNEPGQYLHWACIGSPSFTTEWQHYEKEVEVPSECNNNFHSIAFNLAKDRANEVIYYFDNIVVKLDKGPVVEPTWINVLANSNMEGSDVSCFFKTEQGVGGPMPATITDGAGKDGGRGIIVQSADSPAQDWDTQFFVRLPMTLPAGTKYKVSFDYKSDVDGGADTQAHHEPGQYIHWAFCGSPNFTSEWQHYEQSGSVPAECDGSSDEKNFRTIAFNLAKNKVATQFFFDNFEFFITEDDYATAIKDVVPFKPVDDDAIYNLRGMKVEGTLKPGLYIKNGKKFVVK